MRADEEREAAAGAERERLKALVSQQRQQMAHLRDQISQLRYKSRHLYDAAVEAGAGGGRVVGARSS